MTNESSHLRLVQDVLEVLICHTSEDSYRVISPKEFEKLMAYYADMADQEDRHIFADKAMCELLTNLGYGKGVKIFSDMEKWYG